MGCRGGNVIVRKGGWQDHLSITLANPQQIWVAGPCNPFPVRGGNVIVRGVVLSPNLVSSPSFASAVKECHARFERSDTINANISFLCFPLILVKGGVRQMLLNGGGWSGNN